MQHSNVIRIKILFENIFVYLSVYIKIYVLKKKLYKAIDEANPKSLIKINKYLLLKYFNNSSAILKYLWNLILNTQNVQNELEKEKVIPIQPDLLENLRYVQIQLRICYRAIYLFESWLENPQSPELEILDELHKLNNKSVLFELYKKSAEYLHFSNIEGFVRTDIFNILEILTNTYSITNNELYDIHSWVDIKHCLDQKFYLRLTNAFLVLLTFLFLVVILGHVEYSFLLIPTFVLLSLNFSKFLPFSLIKTYQTIRYLPQEADKSEIIAVLIPIIYNTEPDYQEIISQIYSVENSERHSKIEIYLLFDEADSLVDKTDVYWSEKLKLINEKFSLINHKSVKIKSKINIWIRGYTFNEYDQVFMGYERKRGKVEEFIKWSRGNETKSKIYTNASPIAYKYAFVLDEGMDISQNCISQLLGILIHPANTPVIQNGNVTQGYAIAQPNCITKKKSQRTFFQYLFDKSGFINFSYGETGELLTDLSRKSNFNGKGLINLDVFSELLFNVFPENLVLSHDLLEGSKCRTVTDHLSTIFEEYPENFFMYQKRENRWMRGDINATLFALHKFRYNGKNVSFQMDFADRVRVFMNLINIFRNIFELIFIVLYPSLLIAICIILLLRYATNLFSIAKSLLKNLINYRQISIRYTLHAIIVNFDLFPLFCVINSFNIYIISVSALVISIYRLYTGKYLLEWSTYKQRKNVSIAFTKLDITLFLISVVIFMNFAPINTLVLLILSSFMYFVNIFLAKNYIEKDIEKLNQKQYFYIYNLISDTYKGVTDLMIDKPQNLPVDNVSEDGLIESRFTSITNIGFYLISICCVAKLKIIDEREFLTRIQIVIDILLKLPKVNGNFYNWYNIDNLQPVWGEFVSSADLGNLHICLICFYEYINNLQMVDESILVKTLELLNGINYKNFLNEFEEMSILVDKGGKKSEIYYNIWASETRIASFLAIASGAVLDRHWYSLERTQSFDGIFKSWGGGCFEYFLPAIFFKSDPASLEQYTYKKYAKLSTSQPKNVNPNYPWGQSESIFVDDEDNMQYGPIGISKTCAFPNNTRYYVVAPYATTLCGNMIPISVIENLMNIERFGGRGKYGFYESLSFSKDKVIVAKKYMCHHQCMSIASLTNMITGGFLLDLFANSTYGKKLEYLHNTKITQNANISKIS